MMREALSTMKVLDAGDENLVKDIGKSLQKGNKSFSTRPCDFTFFPPTVSFAYEVCARNGELIFCQVALFPSN